MSFLLCSSFSCTSLHVQYLFLVLGIRLGTLHILDKFSRSCSSHLYPSYMAGLARGLRPPVCLSLFLFWFVFSFLLCLCTCAHTCMPAHAMELVLSFHFPVSPGIQEQVPGLLGEHISPKSHPIDPCCYLRHDLMVWLRLKWNV